MPVVEMWPPDVFGEILAAVAARIYGGGGDLDFSEAYICELSAEEDDLDATTRFDDVVVGYRKCQPAPG